MWREGVGAGVQEKRMVPDEVARKKYSVGSFVYISGVEVGDLRASIKYRLELRPCWTKFLLFSPKK